MLFKNAVIENDKIRDFRVMNGEFSEIAENIETSPDEEIVDLEHKLVLPPFVEAHIHLDTAMTAGDPRHNRSGTLFEGIEIWSERKQSLNKEDVKKRARQAVRLLISHGVQHLRTHVDCTDPTLIAMEAMLELKDEIKDIFDIQIVAFPQEGILSFPNGRDLLENAMKMGADCVGAIPHYEFTREYSVESLKIAMDIAEKYDALVDVHCDEIDYAESHGLETLACLAYERGMGSRVTASHTTAMHSYDNAYMRKLSRLLTLSKINFIANPLVNIHLQGRLDNYPKRRGLTRVKELLANGNNVAFGHDDIMDPWYPMGDGNPMDTVHMGLHVGQLMGYDDIMESYRFVTHRAAACLSLDYGIEKGKKANFVVIDAKHWYEALNRRAAILKSVRGGKVLCGTEPAKSFLNISI